MRRFFMVLTVLTLAATWAAPAAFAERTIKFGHVAPPFAGGAIGAEAFAKYVNEKAKGEIVIKVFPFGQLGPERSMAEQVQAGTLHMASITTAVLSNFVPEVAVMDFPFVFPNRKAAYGVLDDPEFQKRIWGYLPAKGFMGIGWMENEFRDINTTKKVIRTPGDLKGLKIRVMRSPIFMDTFKQLGASPVGIPFPEIYGALQQGVIDGQENPLITSIIIKATEVAKNVTDTDHMLTELITVVNVDVWNSLNPKHQQIFREAAKEMIRVNREAGEALYKKLFKYNISVAEYVKKYNVKVVTLTEAERQAFVEAVKPVWTKYREVVGPEFFDYFLAKIKEHNRK